MDDKEKMMQAGEPVPDTEQTDASEDGKDAASEDKDGAVMTGELVRSRFLADIANGILPFWAKDDREDGIVPEPVPLCLAHAVVSAEDAASLRSWLITLKNRSSIRAYGGAVLDVCDFYGLSLSEISAEQWVSYVRDALPKRRSVNALRRLDRSSIYVHYYAIKAFLPFFRSIKEDFPPESEIEGQFPSAPVPPPPAIRETPDYDEVSQILAYARDHDIRAYTMIVLAYECLLTSSEIRDLRVSSIQKNADGSNVLYVPTRKGDQFIQVTDEVLAILAAYIAAQLTSDSGEVDESRPLFTTGRGNVLTDRYQLIIVHDVQEKLVQSGTIRRSYPLQSFRKAGFNRHLSDLSEDPAKVAQYAGVTGKYAAYLKRFAMPDMAARPDRDRENGRRIRELIAFAKADGAAKPDSLNSPVDICQDGVTRTSCDNMASALREYMRLSAEGVSGLSLVPRHSAESC